MGGGARMRMGRGHGWEGLGEGLEWGGPRG